MKLTINNESRELKYTFNSFRYMEELDITDFDTIDKTPFKIVGLVFTLLNGAVNNDPKNLVSEEVLTEYIEQSLSKGKLITLYEKLITLLTESDFFKQLLKANQSEESPNLEKKKK